MNKVNSGYGDGWGADVYSAALTAYRDARSAYIIINLRSQPMKMIKELNQEEED